MSYSAAPTKYHLYIDDTGSRDPDKADEGMTRKDKMDCFALGGILVLESAIDELIQSHLRFCEAHDIDYPLHSHAIRGGRKKFAWLKTPEKAGLFLPALEEHLLSLPVVVTACVVHRPGYLARYKEEYRERLWLMCKTAFTILIERTAKFVDEQGGAMEVYFEQCGLREDRALVDYMRDLKTNGMAFDQQASKDYAPLGPNDFKRLCLGKPVRKTKATPMIQMADLVLFPIAKSGYVPDYRPYVKLREAGKLIDTHISAEAIPFRGIKYSCFDAPETAKAQPGG
jgi:uncharacterized protein DUF3800